MLKKDFLIQLIGSLSPNEKRYFKLYNNIQGGDSRFMKLFDLLENETTYNAKKLCAELNLTPQQLTGDKHYLQQMLLRCLRSFEEQAADHSAAYIVHMNRADVQLLANRRLLDHAVELADKTIPRGLEWEMFETVSQLLYIKWTSLYNLERLDELSPVVKEYERVLAVMSELNAINALRSEVALAERKRADKEIFAKILSHPLMKKKPESLLSMKAQIGWFEISIKSYMAGGYPPAKALEIAKMQIKHYEKHPDIKRQNPYTFLLGYDFLANAEMQSGDPLKALQALDKEEAELDTLDLSKASIKQWREHVLAVRTGAFYRAGLYRETIAEAEKSVTFLSTRPVYEQLHILFYHTLALLHTGQSGAAIDKLEQLLQLNTGHRMDLQKYFRPAQILAQLDLGNYQVVPYMVKSARAWLKARKITDPELQLFLSSTYSIATAPVSQKRAAWLKLKHEADTGNMPQLEIELCLRAWLKKKPGA